jgi:hypothetical protein
MELLLFSIRNESSGANRQADRWLLKAESFFKRFLLKGDHHVC